MVRQIAVLFAMALALGGCAGHSSNPDDVRADSAYRARSMCQNTAIGSDSRTVCY